MVGVVAMAVASAAAAVGALAVDLNCSQRPWLTLMLQAMDQRAGCIIRMCTNDEQCLLLEAVLKP